VHGNGIRGSREHSHRGLYWVLEVPVKEGALATRRPRTRKRGTAESVIAEAIALRMGADIAGDLAQDALWSLSSAGLLVCEGGADTARSASALVSASLGQHACLPPDKAGETTRKLIGDLEKAGFEIVRRSNRKRR
jgi:hypothetical protein